ncbi:hypothetical protein SUGI_0693710, partial [Cryptomeria japonica]
MRSKECEEMAGGEVNLTLFHDLTPNSGAMHLHPYSVKVLYLSGRIAFLIPATI